MKVGSQSDRMGRVGREHSGYLVQPPCPGRVSLEHTAQDCDCMVPEYPQQGKPRSLSGQGIDTYICIKSVLFSHGINENGIKQEHAEVNRDSQGNQINVAHRDIMDAPGSTQNYVRNT